MVTNAVVLSNSGFIGSSSGSALLWQGGRCSLSIVATAYGGGVFLQTLGPDGVTWINMNATTYSANQVTEYAIPRGQIKLVSNQSSSLGIYATLVSLPYS